jgi:hypothetical protein
VCVLIVQLYWCVHRQARTALCKHLFFITTLAVAYSQCVECLGLLRMERIISHDGGGREIERVISCAIGPHEQICDRAARANVH